VAIDAEELDPERLGVEIFGLDEQGSRPGAFEQAMGGTVYLAGLCRFPMDVQERLLEVLETDGGTVRVIVGSSQDVHAAVVEGNLRRDLLGLFWASSLHLPPLRRRSEDIPLLVDVFQREATGLGGAKTGGFTVDALEMLASYHWPDNVRELRHEVLRLVVNAAEGGLVEAGDLSIRVREGIASDAVPPPDLGALAHKPLADGRKEFERWRILRALYDNRGNQSQAAQVLGLSRAGLFKKMRRLGLVRRSDEDG
jgi:DNA-binding NtrC family response regulator